jgi:hypothetical protein
MSPLWCVGVFEARVAVVERDAAIESLIELDFCASEAEAAVLGRDLEAAALPLHDVVIADDAFVQERADAVESIGGRTPGFGGVARGAREAAVIVGDEALQYGIGRGEITSIEAAKQALEQVEVAFGGFREEELGGKNLTGGIVLHAENSEAGAATLEPVVGAAVELDEFSFTRRAQTALAMGGSAAFTGRAEAFLAKKAAQGLATERESFDLVEFFDEMAVVEASILGARQTQDSQASELGQVAVAGLAAVGVCQR